jgi:hypothetical protein
MSVHPSHASSAKPLSIYFDVTWCSGSTLQSSRAHLVLVHTGPR